MKKYLKKTNLFTLLTQFLIIILPFYVLFAVFFSVKVGIPKAGFYIKELIVVLLFISLIYEFIKNKIKPKFEFVDYLIFLYIGYGIGITVYNGLGIDSIIYGGRYDFMFFIVFLIFKHGKQFLKRSNKQLIKLFLLSSSVSLLFSILIKFRLGEQRLLSFGYVNYISSWIYNGGIPIYHGLENSGIKRFQGIFDGPNQMAFFLILYTSLLLEYVKKKTEYHIILILIIIFGLIILTYSRSALLGIFSGIGIFLLLNLKYIYKKYRKQLITITTIFVILSGSLLFIFSDKVSNIFIRTSSTKGHFDRMEIGYKRFLSEPIGAGLAEAGPAYRNIYPDKQTKIAEQFYIPESWFIQQLIEGGYIYFILFLLILLNILLNLYKNSKPLFIGFIAILIMNIFLHIFEATYLSILLFIFIGIYYSTLIKSKKLA